MIHLMVGIQGSGKSTLSKELAKKFNCEIISTDAIRKANPGIEERLVWTKVYERIHECAVGNIDCIFDATSITKKVRERFFIEAKIKETNASVECWFLDTDPSLCHERVIERNKDKEELYLPPEVVLNYAEKLEPPTIDEGFSEIHVIKTKK